MNNVCVIPARGGSSRIPRKNIKTFCGKPIISWVIESATKSQCFSDIFVSTDDLEIADISKQFGANILHRNEKLSSNFATINDVMSDICYNYKFKTQPSSVCCLFATAPFISPKHIRLGLDLLQDKNYVFTVSELITSPLRSFNLRGNKFSSMYSPQHSFSRTQDLEKFYFDAGQMYWGSFDSWLQSMPIYTAHSNVIQLSRNEFIDIDTEDDWSLAELIFKNILAIH